MTISISETIRKHLGWCPNARTIRTKSGSGADGSLRAGTVSAGSSGPAGIASGRPGDWWYEHTQRGALIIGSVSIVAIIILATMYFFGIVWVAALVLGIMIFILAIMSTLTVSVCDGTLQIRYGPVGLIRKRWPVTDIASVTAVTNPWYYGWGIRVTPHGTLYNISGYGAVEIRMLDGKTFRIGTDEPEALGKAIESSRAMGSGPRVGDR